ncbi:MAG: hypothetical protein E7022_02320 [Desulfovibrio desulfuricans]|jgi:hypothetical protein|nr:hypothetical protein [Desulfovibrio desulfuricans]
MLRPSLILAAVLPLMLCGEPESSGKGIEGAVTYAAYHSEWGEKLTPPVARSIHLELTRDRLRASLTGEMPALIYAGPVNGKTFDEIAGLLLAMDAASWPGSTGDEDRGERRKDRCAWSVCVAAKTPGYRQMRAYGADSGRGTPRLEAEARLCGYLKKKLPELHASMPKRLERLSFINRPAGGYWSVVAEEGRVRVCIIAKGQPEAEFYADPGLLQELRSLLDRNEADAWHGFGYGRYEPGRMPLYLDAAYSTGQSVVVMAEPGGMPKGFAEFCDALSARLAALARRWQETGAVPAGGIKSFRFGENGMRMEAQYVFYRRLDAGGARAHVMRVWGGAPDGDAPLSEAEEQELAGILRALAPWDGFAGNARDVLDAPGFSFSVEFADGRSISAGGYGMSPTGYREGRDRFLNFIEKRLPESTRGR